MDETCRTPKIDLWTNLNTGSCPVYSPDGHKRVHMLPLSAVLPY